MPDMAFCVSLCLHSTRSLFMLDSNDRQTYSRAAIKKMLAVVRNRLRPQDMGL